jgi:hypothetical protein
VSENKVYGFDIDQFQSDEIIDLIGLGKFSIAQLLDGLSEGATEIRYWIDRDPEGEEEEIKVIEAENNYSIFAYEINKRLKHEIGDMLPKFYIEDRTKKTGFTTDMLKFWIDRDAICFLYDVLKSDGFYRREWMQ